MLFDRLTTHGVPASSLTACTALMLCAGLAVAQPSKAVEPTKITVLEGADGEPNHDNDAPSGYERRLLPTRGPSRMMDIKSIDGITAEAVPSWMNAPAARMHFPASGPPTTILNSSLIVEVAREADLLEALTKTPMSRERGWFDRNVRRLGTSEPLYAMQFTSVREAMDMAEVLLEDDLVIEAEISVSAPTQHLTLPSDPLVTQQYFFSNPTPDDDIGEAQDHGLSPVYDLGYTGAGVTVGVLEAFDYTYQSFHEELVNKHVEGLSLEANPFTADALFFHGNAVAALIGAEAENGLGGAGVAYNSRLVALLNGTSLNQIDSYLASPDIIRLKNHSWGFIGAAGSLTFGGSYFGITTDPGVYQFTSPGRALRGSGWDKGVINVMATGNSGHWTPSYSPFNTNRVVIDATPMITEFASSDGADNFDSTWTGIGDRTEYSSTAKWREVLAITAVAENNRIAGYSTTGTNVVASAYSQGFSNFLELRLGQGFNSQRGIVTADALDGADLYGLGDGYQDSFNGTSAAAPIATGIIALMLEANPDLSVRDIKHILQGTADWTRIPSAFNELVNNNYIGPTNYFGWPSVGGGGSTWWQVNAGYQVHSDEFGFGIIDAEAAVRGARQYGGAPPLVILDSGVITLEDPLDIPGPEYLEIDELNAIVDANTLQLVNPPSLCVKPNILIEEVELSVTITGAGSGDLLIGIQSGAESFSTFAFPRVDGGSTVVGGVNYAYYEYKFNSLKHWGEHSGGEWFLLLSDMAPDTAMPIQGDEEEGDATIFYPPGTSVGIETVYEPKALVNYQLKIYGTKTGLDPYALCSLLSPSCPGDVDGDGKVTPKDLMAYIDLYLAGSFLADVDNDGDVDYNDLLTFYRNWVAGPCGGTTTPGSRQVAPEGEIITIG